MTRAPVTSLPRSPDSPIGPIHTAADSPLTDTADFYRRAAASGLDPHRRGPFGQFMTPAPIARFMASLFAPPPHHMRVLDPGAGVGSLTAAFAERLRSPTTEPSSVDFVCYEIEPLLLDYLDRTIQQTLRTCRESRTRWLLPASIDEDFVLSPPGQPGLVPPWRRRSAASRTSS